MAESHASKTPLRVCACLLIVHVLLLFTAFSALAPAFGFPEVLRLPPEEILARFRERQALIVPVYYLFTCTGISFAGFAVLLHMTFKNESPALSAACCAAGVLTGFCQALGFIRWCFVVPALAETALDPAASPARREAAIVVFDAIHNYAGVAVGENLAFVLHGAWTAGIGLLLLRDRRFDRRLGPLGISIGAAIGLYSLEQFGGPFAFLGPLNVIMHDFWAVWLGLIAVQLWRLSTNTEPVSMTFGVRGWGVASASLVALLALTHM